MASLTVLGNANKMLIKKILIYEREDARPSKT